MSPVAEASAGLADDRRRLILRSIERAAPPTERVSGDHFVARAAQDADRIERRAARWRERIAGDEPERFAAYLDGRGLDEAALRAGLADVELRDPVALPAWASALLAAFEAADGGGAGRDSALYPLLEDAAPFLDRTGQVVFQRG